MWWVSVLLLVLPVVWVLARPDPAAAIANGQNVPEGRYGFAVRLTMEGIPTATGDRRDSFCSGSLIAPRWVITAGHCFRNARGVRVAKPVARRTTATVGRTVLSGTAGHVVTVVAVRQSSVTDVALAKLETPITDVEPIRIRRRAPTVGAEVTLAGYGFTRSASRPASRLQSGEFRVASRTGTYLGMTGTAPKRTTSPCPHDSGGPYFTERKDGLAELVAVVSRGPDCPHSDVDQSARIDTITDWVTDVVGRLPTTKPSPSTTTRSQRSPAPAPPLAAPTPRASGQPAGGIVLWSAGSVLLVAAVGTAALTSASSRRRRRAHRATGVRRHRA